MFHRTDASGAAEILAGGFRDSTGQFLTEETHTGVFLSNVPLGAREGAVGEELLAVFADITDEEAKFYEWAEDGKPYREWMFPADFINPRVSVVRVTAVEFDFDFESIVTKLSEAVEPPGCRLIRKGFGSDLVRDTDA